eukprot:TRINITY_DN1131_c0_g2_i4.p1 TRINITY_DN1131_c0_g2~~TRINITY_DN1131_c0_g2_i4.p1  ORF type:complete len:1041 (+),score=451.80 TRINITY_DN1131_c0_g2_i4:54-3125(+)
MEGEEDGQHELAAMRNYMEQLRAQLESSEKDASVLRLKLSRISGGDAEGDDAGATLRDQRKEIDQLRQQLATSEQRSTQLAEQEIANTKEIEEHRTRLAKASEDNRDLLERKMEAEKAAVDLRKRVQEVTGELAAEKAHKIRVSEERDKERARADGLLAEVRQTRAEWQQQRRELEGELEKRESLVAGQQESKATMERAEARCAELEAEKRQLIKEARQCVSKLRRENQQLERTRETTDASTAAHTRRTAELERQVADTEARLNEERRAKVQSETRAQGRHKKLAEQLQEAKAEASRLKDALDAVHPMIRDGGGHVAPYTFSDVLQMRGDLDTLTRERNACRDRVAALSTETSELREKLEKSEHLCGKLRVDNTRLDISHSMALQDLAAEQRHPGSAAEAAAQRLTDLERKHEEERRTSERQLSATQEELVAVRTMLDEQRRMNAASDQQLACLKSSLELLGGSSAAPPGPTPATPDSGKGATKPAADSAATDERVSELEQANRDLRRTLEREKQSAQTQHQADTEKMERQKLTIDVLRSSVQFHKQQLSLAEELVAAHRESADRSDEYAAKADLTVLEQARELDKCEAARKRAESEALRLSEVRAALLTSTDALLASVVPAVGVKEAVKELLERQDRVGDEAQSALRKDLDVSRQESLKLTSDCDSLRQKLSVAVKQHQQECVKLQERLAGTEAQLGSLNVQRERQQKELESRQRLLQQANDRAEKLESKMRIKNQGVSEEDVDLLAIVGDDQKYEQQLDLEREKEARKLAEDELASVKNEHITPSAETAKLQTLCELEAENADLVQQLKAEREGRTHQEALLAKKGEDLNARETTVREQEDKLKATLEKLQQENASLKKSLEKEQEDHSRDIKTHQKAVDDYAEMERRYESRTVENGQLITENEALTQALRKGISEGTVRAEAALLIPAEEPRRSALFDEDIDNADNDGDGDAEADPAWLDGQSDDERPAPHSSPKKPTDAEVRSDAGSGGGAPSGSKRRRDPDEGPGLSSPKRLREDTEE